MIEITASSSSVPPLAQSHHLQVSSVPAVQSLSVPSDRRLGLRERAGTPGVSTGSSVAALYHISTRLGHVEIGN